MQFTDEELETLKAILSDHGSDCPSADYAKVQALGVKLGVWEEEKPPTEEELQRRKDFQESPTGKAIAESLKRANEQFAKQLVDYKSDFDFINDASFGTMLKIKLPSDFKI